MYGSVWLVLPHTEKLDLYYHILVILIGIITYGWFLWSEWLILLLHTVQFESYYHIWLILLNTGKFDWYYHILVILIGIITYRCFDWYWSDWLILVRLIDLNTYESVWLILLHTGKFDWYYHIRVTLIDITTFG